MDARDAPVFKTHMDLAAELRAQWGLPGRSVAEAAALSSGGPLVAPPAAVAAVSGAGNAPAIIRSAAPTIRAATDGPSAAQSELRAADADAPSGRARKKAKKRSRGDAPEQRGGGPDVDAAQFEREMTPTNVAAATAPPTTTATADGGAAPTRTHDREATSTTAAPIPVRRSIRTRTTQPAPVSADEVSKVYGLYRSTALFEV